MSPKTQKAAIEKAEIFAEDVYSGKASGDLLHALKALNLQYVKAGEESNKVAIVNTAIKSLELLTKSLFLTPEKRAAEKSRAEEEAKQAEEARVKQELYDAYTAKQSS